MKTQWQEFWRFETARLAVIFAVAPEDMDPADSFQFEEDIEAVRSERVLWFQARVTVELDGEEVAADYLGGCAYETVEEFYTSHRDPEPMHRNSSVMREARGAVSICHYFPSMVAEALAEARRNIAARQANPLRLRTEA